MSTMAGVEQITDWVGQEVLDTEGESLGKLEDVYVAADGEPRLAVIKHGLLGRKHTVAPLTGAGVGRDYVRVAYSSAQVARANDAVGIELAERIGGMTVQQLGEAFGAPLAAEDLDSAKAIREREDSAREAAKRASQLEAEAREHDEAAKSAEALAQEHSGQAGDAQLAARQAREEADRLQP